MPYKKLIFGTAVMTLAICFATTITSCNNEGEKAAPAEEKKTETAPATTTPPDTSVKKVMDTTASQRPTKPGA